MQKMFFFRHYSTLICVDMHLAKRQIVQITWLSSSRNAYCVWTAVEVVFRVNQTPKIFNTSQVYHILFHLLTSLCWVQQSILSIWWARDLKAFCECGAWKEWLQQWLCLWQFHYLIQERENPPSIKTKALQKSQESQTYCFICVFCEMGVWQHDTGLRVCTSTR